VERDDDGRERRLFDYHFDGQAHRPSADGPAAMHTDADGHVLFEAYLEHGVYHRDPLDGPALIERHAATRSIVTEEYRYQGLLHRDEHQGPASACFTPGTADPHHEAYYCNGEPHRLNGPAVIERSVATGDSQNEWHFCEGQLHREDGPAIVLRHPDGAICYEAWYCDDVLIEERGDPDATPLTSVASHSQTFQPISPCHGAGKSVPSPVYCLP
jgi:hypothetical protein